MKKIKVLVPNEIVELLEQDKLVTKKNINRIHNIIVDYYLENGVSKENKKVEINSQLQFYLYDHLVEKYFNFLRKNEYEKESDFLRDVYCDYALKSEEERFNILKK